MRHLYSGEGIHTNHSLDLHGYSMMSWSFLKMEFSILSRTDLSVKEPSFIVSGASSENGAPVPHL